MAKINKNDILSALKVKKSEDVMNLIKQSSRSLSHVPDATLTNISEVGAGVLESSQSRNEFISTLVDRIGLIVIIKKQLNNPLKKFKKGKMPLGKTIEEIFTDISPEHDFDPDTASQEVFKRIKPDVLTNFHQIMREKFFKQTIQQVTLQKAFTSWSSFDDFISSILSSMYNSAEVHEYLYMKKLLDSYIAKGYMNTVTVTDPFLGQENIKDFVKKIRSTTNHMCLQQGSRKFNNMGVHTTSNKQNLHLFITPDLEAEIDVEVLAAAFNMTKADVGNNITLVEGFENPNVKAVLVDDSFFVVYDKLYQMNNVYNAQGLYWNNTLHVHQLMSASRFANAVAFVVDSTPTSNVLSINISANSYLLNPSDLLTLEARFITENNEVPVLEDTLVWTASQLTGETPTALPTPVYDNYEHTVSIVIPSDFPESTWEITAKADIVDNELPDNEVTSEPIVIEVTHNKAV